MTTKLPLIKTKLYIPHVRPGLVDRPRLTERLENGAHRKLTLISAPAGFGKTTCTTAWVCNSVREVAWVSLDQDDNDPVQFLRYLIAALQQVEGTIGRSLQPLLNSPKMPPAQSLVVPLVNDLAALDGVLTVVLDDYHEIHSPDVHEMVRFVLENQPPATHLLISTRYDPPLPLVRLRARDQITEIREHDLRFTSDEAAAFLERTMGLALSARDIEAIEARTEGWAAGLQLTALALQEEPSPERTATFVANLARKDRYIVGYLLAEVLAQQPERVRTFVRQTSILNRLTAPLCDAVTGRQDSQALLDQLAHANLFAKALDNQHEWYQYEPLFAQALCADLAPEERMPLHQCAARWYEKQGHLGQAIHHALAHAEGTRDYQDAQRLILTAIETTIDQGSIVTAREWLSSLPEKNVHTHAELATYMAWILSVSGDMPLADEYAQAAQARLNAQSSDTVRGKLLSVRSFLAVLLHQDYAQAIALSRAALQALRDDPAHWRVLALWTMAEAQERTCRITEAIDTLWQARRLGRALNNQTLAATVEAFLATGLHAHGDRKQALRICDQGIRQYRDKTGNVLPIACLLYSQMGWLHYEANDLDAARTYLEKGRALGEQLALDSDMTFTLGRLAQVQYALGETAAARESIERAYQIAIRTRHTNTRWLSALQATLNIREGNLASAQHWADRAGLVPEQDPDYLVLEQRLAYARMLTAQGQLSDARRVLVRLECFVRERALERWLITVHILQASVALRAGERDIARELLARAVKRAAPQALYRPFLDEDPDTLALLPEVRSVAHAFVSQLCSDAASIRPNPQHADSYLVEPLSDREKQVLDLIAAGLANREIADELVIAPGTVKRHINHIYAKLGVRRRTQAIARGRELALI